MNKVELYFKRRLTVRGLRKEWRWRITAANGRIIGGSTEGYWNRSDAVANIEANANALSAYIIDHP